MRILLLDINCPEVLYEFYKNITASFSDIIVEFDKQLTGIEAFDLVITHDPIDVKNLSLRILGQRVLNRKERLIVAKKQNILMAPWFESMDSKEISNLFSKWNTDKIVYKKDFSFRSRQVYLVDKKNIDALLIDYDPSSDVLMKFINGNPKTYKLDVFYNQIVNFREIHTPSMSNINLFNSSFYYEKGCLQKITEELKTIVQRLSGELLKYGSIFYSLDFMLHNDNYYLIEINTCGIDRKDTWPYYDNLYIENYIKGLRSFITDNPKVPTLSQCYENKNKLLLEFSS